MDITGVTDIIGWIIGLSAGSIVTLVVGIIAIIKAGKLLPKELKALDLDNRMKEADLAFKMEGAADRAVMKSEAMRLRLDSLDEKYSQLENKVEEQDKIIISQNLRITTQELEISTLICELGNYKIYTNALIAQMKQASIIPIEMESLDIEECDKVEIPKRIRRKKK